MKNLIKKQEEELGFLALAIKGSTNEEYPADLCNLKEFVSKVRKETALAVCDEMIGEERKKCQNDYLIGCNKRIKEEKEIKKQIIESL